MRRDLGQQPPIRPVEPKLTVRLASDLVTVLVNGAVMPATEQNEIRERGGAPLGPVADVMALPEAKLAAREAAATISVVKGPP